MRPTGRLHVLTDTDLQDRLSHREIAQHAIAGGADCIQFRQKEGSTRALIAQARDVADLCRRKGVPLIINDRIDVAIAADAAGVHLGQDDFPISLARELLGPDRIVGGSAGNLEEARAAERAGADYVGFGAVYGTRSKQDASAPQGLARLAEVAEALEIPVVAIGGIGLEQVTEVMGTGAHGLAVLEAVTLAEDPEGAARRMRAAIDAILGGPPK